MDGLGQMQDAMKADKSSQDRGRWPRIAAIVLGVLGTLILAVVAAVDSSLL